MPTIKPKIKSPIFIKRKEGVNKLSKKTLTKLDVKEKESIKKIKSHYNTLQESNVNKIHFNKLLKAIDSLKIKNLKNAALGLENKKYINIKLLELEKKVSELNTEIKNLERTNTRLSLDKLEEFGLVYMKYYEIFRRLQKYNFRKGIYKRK